MTKKKIHIFFLDIILNYKRKKIKLEFYYILLLFLILISLNKYKKNKIKVCLCTVGKLENRYILEFVDHYKKYHIDKIILYDNNDINGEKFEDLLSDYLKLNFIEIINHRGETKIQIKMFQDCYKNNYKKYDWLLFYDIDEFIHLKKFHSIKDFLIQSKFNNCQSIYLNWIIHTDNNLIFYDNRLLSRRFTETFKRANFCIGKTIIRGNIENLEFHSAHSLDFNIGRCNGFGKIIKLKINRYCKVPDYKYFYIDHYYSKSTEEFINKINRGSGTRGQNIKKKYGRIQNYFIFNKITEEKINLIIEKTYLNISLLMNNSNNKLEC